MPSILSNTAALNAQANLSRAQTNITSQLSRLSSGLRINLPSTDRAAEIAEQMRRATASSASASAAQQTVNNGQAEDTNLGATAEILGKMSNLVLSASSTAGADRSTINEELSKLKTELQGLASSSTSDVLNKSFETASGNSYHVLDSAAGQGSREISISESTTAGDLADMMSALGSMQSDVGVARSKNNQALTEAMASQTNALAQSARDSGLDLIDFGANDMVDLTARANMAKELLEKSALAMANVLPALFR
ncbi:hypothetical protein [Agrobacterium sp.]|uniref:flagellin n=1 Tax=Agrobacterium sp. TaxID=361 RepID=UPI0028A69E68|nr:hypothetical protein [Agrobacterium sp.]